MTKNTDWKRKQGNAYSFGATIAQTPGAFWERRKPALESKSPLLSHYLTPALQAITTGFVSTIVAHAVATTITFTDDVWKFAYACGAVVGGVAWFRLLIDDRRLLWEIETVTGRDIDGDGEVGEPEKQKTDTLPLIIKRGTNNFGSDTDWHYFLGQIQKGRLTARQWTGEEVEWDLANFPSGIDVRKAWQYHCQELVRLGCATREWQTAPLEITRQWRDVYQRVFG